MIIRLKRSRSVFLLRFAAGVTLASGAIMYPAQVISAKVADDSHNSNSCRVTESGIKDLSNGEEVEICPIETPGSTESDIGDTSDN